MDIGESREVMLAGWRELEVVILPAITLYLLTEKECKDTSCLTAKNTKLDVMKLVD